MPVLGWFLRVLLVVVLVRIVWRFIRGVLDGASGTPSRQAKRGEPAAVPLVRDPVCGTYVVADRALAIQADGTTHHFCSDACRREFERSRTASKSA